MITSLQEVEIGARDVGMTTEVESYHRETGKEKRKKNGMAGIATSKVDLRSQEVEEGKLDLRQNNV